MLVSTARAEGYSKLMLGENCTRLAVKLLANIAMGRGAQLAVDTVRGENINYYIHSSLSCLTFDMTLILFGCFAKFVPSIYTYNINHIFLASYC